MLLFYISSPAERKGKRRGITYSLSNRRGKEKSITATKYGTAGPDRRSIREKGKKREREKVDHASPGSLMVSCVEGKGKGGEGEGRMGRTNPTHYLLVD